jgi:hypothetical protein
MYNAINKKFKKPILTVENDPATAYNAAEIEDY